MEFPKKIQIERMYQIVYFHTIQAQPLLVFRNKDTTYGLLVEPYKDKVLMKVVNLTHQSMENVYKGIPNVQKT